jgi:hypothetical protein
MAPLSIGFGVLLTLLGAGFCGGVYAVKEQFQFTALIPAFFGLALVVLGLVARNEKARMHAMHGAALLGLVGFGMPAIMVIRGLINGSGVGPSQIEQIAMVALCLTFVGLCVKSFVDARAARKAKEAETAAK